MKARDWAAFLIGAAAIAGCTAILGVDDPSPYEPTTTNQSKPDASVVVATDATTPACDANLTTDPNNCGRCGRTCGGSLTCADGRCEAVALVQDLSTAPVRLVVGDGRLFFSKNSFYKDGGAGGALFCDESDIFEIPLDGGAPPKWIGAPCAASSVPWGTDGSSIYSWNSTTGSTVHGAFVRYGVQGIADGGGGAMGTVEIPDPSLISNTVIPDPVVPGAVLLFQSVPILDASIGEIVSYTPDSGISPLLALVPPGSTNPLATETLGTAGSFSSTTTDFVVSSGDNVTGQQDIWTAPRGCQTSSCGQALTSSYASICGVQKFDNVIRWCAVQATPSVGLLLLLEVDTTTKIVQVRNTAAVLPISSTGAVRTPIMALSDLGIYYITGASINLLPLAGPPQPIAATRTIATQLATDATSVYWAEIDAIYRVVK